MSRYKVCYEGFAMVEANSEDEAKEKVEDSEEDYAESWITSVEKDDDYEY